MSVTLLPMIIGNPASNVGTSGTIRYYASKDFTASDGTKYKGGRLDSKDYFLSNTWTVSGGLLTVPTSVPVTDSEEWFINGILQRPGGDYSISGLTITAIKIPETDDWISVNYRY